MTSVLEKGNLRREPNPAKRSFKRSFRTVSALTALVAAVVVSPPVQAFENLTQAEREALTVRFLQSVRHGVNLRALFRRTYGSGAERELNSYITRLANGSSKRRIAAGASYCNEAVGQFARLTALPQTQLAAFSVGEVSVAALPPASPRLPIREATLPR